MKLLHTNFETKTPNKKVIVKISNENLGSDLLMVSKVKITSQVFPTIYDVLKAEVPILSIKDAVYRLLGESTRSGKILSGRAQRSRGCQNTQKRCV